MDEANRYRGDGKLFKVDNLLPSNSAITAVNVTSKDGDETETASNSSTASDITATGGDEIRVAIKVSGNVLFRDSEIRVQLVPLDINGTSGGVSYRAGDVAPQAKSKSFKAPQVIAASSRFIASYLDGK